MRPKLSASTAVMKSSIRLLVLLVVLLPQAFGRSCPQVEGGGGEADPRQGAGENETLVDRWCKELAEADSPRISEILREQNQLVEDLLGAHREGLTREKARYETERDEYLAAKQALLDRLMGDLRRFQEDQRKAGDPRDILDSIREMVSYLEEEGSLPVALNPLEGRKRKDGRRSVTVRGKKEKIETVAFGGHEYALMPALANWLEAKLWCEERGGYLACIETREELEFIGSEMIGLERPATPRLDAMQPHRLNYWVGASDSRSNGRWSWLSGAAVDMSLFHREGIPPQPSDFQWGEHHGGVVVYKHPEREEPEVGLIDWNMASRGRAVCEWGRSELPAPWSALSDAEVEELLVPRWRELQDVEGDFEAAREKLEFGAKHRRQVEAFRRASSKRRGELGKQLERLRRDSVKAGQDHYTLVLKDLAGGLELGGFDCSPPLLAWERPVTAHRVVGRAFGKSYLVIDEPMTFHDAEEYCRQLGGRLPSPRSWLEMDLLLHVMGLEGTTTETWLGIAHHPYGPRAGWWSDAGALGQDSPRWMKGFLEGVGDPHQKDLYAFALVLRLADSHGGGEEVTNPREPHVLNTQNRRTFICVAEDF